MRVFTIIIYILAAVCIITGGKDFIIGIGGLSGLGADVSQAALRDPALNNGFQFFAGIWIGVGILFILFLRDLTKYKTAMLTLMAIVFLGGIGRVISILKFGMPETDSGQRIIILGLVIELLLMPILALFLSRKIK